MSEIIFISIGGFLGAISRFALSRKIQSQTQSAFPLGTLTVNLIGAFLLGFIMGYKIKEILYDLWGVGFMGAFTTFSTLKLESEQLRSSRKNKLFYAYLIASYALGLALVFIGYWIGQKI